MADGNLTQKSGYLDVKQSSRVKGRKLKSWRKRWVVVTKMTDLATGTVAAKVDIYTDDPASRQCQGRAPDRMTFVLDIVTAVQLASSKTHPFAFEIVETEPVLVLSGSSEMESFSWMSALRHIFFADANAHDTESFPVSVQPNADSQRLSLSGKYTLRVSPEGVALLAAPPTSTPSTPTSTPATPTSALATPPTPTRHVPVTSPLTQPQSLVFGHRRQGSDREYAQVHRSQSSDRDHALGQQNESGGAGGAELVAADTDVEVEVIAWKLSMLKRFNVEEAGISGHPKVFLLDCGPNSPSGEATLRFACNQAINILASIRRCINVAMAMRQHARPAATSESRGRTESIMTVTGYQALLDRSPRVDPQHHHNITGGAEVEGGGGGGAASALPGDTKVKSRSFRSGSGSSLSTVTPSSPTSSAGDVGTSADNVSAEYDEEGVAIPRVHRSSVNSLPGCSAYSSSPRASDTFGSDLQRQQELCMQQWQQQQQQHRNSPQPWAPQQQQLQQTQQWLQQQAVPSDTQQKQQVQQWTQQQQPQQPEVQNLLKNRAGITRNSSVPNGISMATEDKGYSMIGTEDVIRFRTNSLTTERPRASESVCSGDSGVVADRTSTRRGSNSFDSTVSTESSVSNRKKSDVAEPILESPLTTETPLPLANSALSGDKTTPDGSNPHIYQSLDAVGADGLRANKRLSSFGQGLGGRRSQSTGDVRKENDYEEVEGLRKGVGPAASVMAVTDVVDTPPELPARPASFLHGKGKALHRSRLSSALGFLSAIKGRREKDLSCEGSPTSTKEELLTQCSNTDLYSTINDVDSKVQRRRRSSDITPVSSYLDLRFQEYPAPTQDESKPVPAPRDSVQQRVSGANLPNTAGAASKPEPQNLLTFSDNDVSQRSDARSLKLPHNNNNNNNNNNGGGSGMAHKQGPNPDSVLDSKAALLDFFLNDATFHANPMVTGDLALGGAGSSAAATSACPDPVVVGVDKFDKFPQPAFSNQAGAVNPATGWADFSNPALFSNFQAGGGDPWTPEATSTDPASSMFAPFASSSPSSPLTQTSPPADSFGGVGRGDTGITASVEGVYIDMRKRPEGEEGEGGGGCEYVAPGDVTKDQAFLDFLLFQ